MLADLKSKLAVVAAAVKNSVTRAAAEKIAKAKAKAAEMRVKVEEARDRQHLLDAVPGNDEKEVKEKKLEEIEQVAAEYQEICNLLREAEVELSRARKSALAEREQIVATAQAMVEEVRSEKERIESDPDVAFFGWLHQLAKQKENPDQRLAVALINGAIAKDLLMEIDGKTARARQEAAKAARAAKEAEEAKEVWRQQKQHEENRQAPFFWVRVKPRGNVRQGEMEPDDHFRYISGGTGFYDRSTDGARKRLSFFALQDLWRAVNDAKKAAYEAARDVKQHSYLELREIAAGQTGQAWAEVTAARPWEPTIFNRETNQVERLKKDGKEVVNFGPVVVESPKPGVLRVLNTVQSGMFHPLRLAGAWEEKDGKFESIDFKFFPGDSPFAGLKLVDDTMHCLSQARLGRLRAILCLAGGFQPPAKKEEANGGGASKALPEEVHALTTRPGYRSDGTKAGEPRKDKGRSRRKVDSEEE